MNAVKRNLINILCDTIKETDDQTLLNIAREILGDNDRDLLQYKQWLQKKTSGED